MLRAAAIVTGIMPSDANFPENTVGWYCKTTALPESDLGKRVSIEFDGVYRYCIVWVNGGRLVLRRAGTYRHVGLQKPLLCTETRTLVTGPATCGYHKVTWDGRNDDGIPVENRFDSDT